MQLSRGFHGHNRDLSKVGPALMVMWSWPAALLGPIYRIIDPVDPITFRNWAGFEASDKPIT